MEACRQCNRLAAIGAGRDPRPRCALALRLTLLAALFQTGCVATPQECVSQYNGVSYPDSMYFGHHATCWKQWPREWVGCPGETGETVESDWPRGAGRGDPAGPVRRRLEGAVGRRTRTSTCADAHRCAAAAAILQSATRRSAALRSAARRNAGPAAHGAARRNARSVAHDATRRTAGKSIDGAAG